ncbi:hypothetical protein SARC_06191 [Sphaeroforma arctica JP610]|uniref:Uncharacterized protein n=1 Tax=Sphaeroforma arctica JP610 TaxID=667725 RepID=A0A0L0FXC2_9EUKA|nr:hypothetical protein SARC_06191 [Sphaeroforma arctica JP610]KNC81482.1 hypothetical protein SARC_06191 [Sphaeroforma arctica JP610]|eukprot:XP_014155384.1 hypothetical protein SARC_06191 [Sphaeroforma arctica JP610]
MHSARLVHASASSLELVLHISIGSQVGEQLKQARVRAAIAIPADDVARSIELKNLILVKSQTIHEYWSGPWYEARANDDYICITTVLIMMVGWEYGLILLSVMAAAMTIGFFLEKPMWDQVAESVNCASHAADVVVTDVVEMKSIVQMYNTTEAELDQIKAIYSGSVGPQSSLLIKIFALDTLGTLFKAWAQPVLVIYYYYAHRDGDDDMYQFYT